MLEKDSIAWLNQWGIDENVTLQDINSIKSSITTKFKEKMWSEKDLEVKMKLRYYKEVSNPNVDDHIYLYNLTSSKKKTNI